MELNVIYRASCENLSALDDSSVALTVTSPPYWNAIDYDVHSKAGDQADYRTRTYSEGYEGYDEYLDWIERIFGRLLSKTIPGGFCAIVIGTVLMNGRQFRGNAGVIVIASQVSDQAGIVKALDFQGNGFLLVPDINPVLVKRQFIRESDQELDYQEHGH